MHRKTKIFALVGTSLACASIATWLYQSYWQPTRTALWKTRTHKNLSSTPLRQPAQFTETDLPLIEDYFQYNNFHHYISYRLGLELRADAKKRDQEKAHEALNKTIHQMFNHVDKMKTLKAFASPTLTTDFVSLYLDHLDRKNVNQG